MNEDIQKELLTFLQKTQLRDDDLVKSIIVLQKDVEQLLAYTKEMKTEYMQIQAENTLVQKNMETRIRYVEKSLSDFDKAISRTKSYALAIAGVMAWLFQIGIDYITKHWP